MNVCVKEENVACINISCKAQYCFHAYWGYRLTAYLSSHAFVKFQKRRKNNLFVITYPFQGHGEAGAFPRCHGVRARVTSLSYDYNTY